jgi:hypothetical protein
MPPAADATPSFARRFPRATLAFTLIEPSGLTGQPSGEDVGDEYNDLRSAVSYNCGCECTRRRPRSAARSRSPPNCGKFLLTSDGQCQSSFNLAATRALSRCP